MLTIVRPILSPLKSSSPALCNRASYKKRKKGGNQNWIESNSSALLKKLELFFFFFFYLPWLGFTWYITCQNVYKTIIIILVATQYTPVYI